MCYTLLFGKYNANIYNKCKNNNNNIVLTNACDHISVVRKQIFFICNDKRQAKLEKKRNNLKQLNILMRFIWPFSGE